MPLPNPVIVVPGITATHLMDHYPVSPETVWGVMPYNKKYERAALHPDDLRYEAREPTRVIPDQLFEVAYGELIEELRSDLTENEDYPVPVYPFGYDWRQPLQDIDTKLAEFILEVAARTRLMRHYHDDNYEDRMAVDLVGHSMGGLLIAGALQRFQGTLPIGKVATLATPYRGSFEPVIKLITGKANLGTSVPSSRERKAARMTPSLFHLLPVVENGLFLDGEPIQDLYNPHIWQGSVLRTIESYVRTRGLPVENMEDHAFDIFSKLLEDAKSYRDTLDSIALNDLHMSPNDWLCIAGVNAVTRVEMNIETKGRDYEFVLSEDDRRNEWRDDADSLKTGDGTVPIECAIPKFLDPSNVVCIIPGDFHFTEVGDIVAAYQFGFHGLLPNMNMLHQLIVRHFTGSPDRHGNTWGRSVPGVDDWNPPMELHRKNKA